MNESLITVRYAKAFYELAAEQNFLDAIKKDMELILSVAREVDTFRFFLSSVMIKSDAKNKLFSILFEKNTHPLTIRLFRLLVENKREPYLEGICRNFLTHLNRERDIKEASVITAHELPNDLKMTLEKYIARHFNSNIKLNAITDPSIIGGFVLKIDNEQINASVSSQLDKIRRELINS